MTPLEKYYGKFKEEHRLTTRHGQVEFTVSMKYIHDYLEQIKASSNTKKLLLFVTLVLLIYASASDYFRIYLLKESYSTSVAYICTVQDYFKVVRSTDRNK